ncbi:MAG: hypothetical protein ACIAXF_08660 [Phycisphaerales bacterium JB063]
MDSKAIEFLVLCVFSVLAIVAGYVARERGWLREEFSRRIHWVTIVVLWSLGGLLSLWNLAPEPANLWVLLIVPLSVAVPAYLTLWLAKAMKMRPTRVGVLVIAAGTGNSGFTLGAFLCYTLLPSPDLLARELATGAEAETLAYNALAYGVLTVMTMSAAAVFLLFPLAYKLGENGQGDAPLRTVIFRSFVDWKAMMFYLATVGVTLAYLRVPFPQVVHDWHLLKILFYLGAAGAYFGVGMRLHLSEIRPNAKAHILLAGMKFVALPLFLGVILLAATRLGVVDPPPPLMAQSLMLLAFMPAAIQTVILSNLFHLDARMASSVWVVNTVVFFMIPLPLLLIAVRWL